MSRREAAIVAGLLLTGLACRAEPAHAAGLRPFVTIKQPVVRLSDLFSGLEPGQDCMLGPGPAPGHQLVIGEAQLQAIADEFGVAWNAGPGLQTATLSRPGRPLAASAVIEAVTKVLTPLGMAPGSEVTLTGWTDIVIDPLSRLSVEDASFDPVTDRFSADLVLSGAVGSTTRVPIEGSAVVMASVVVSARPVMPGQILGPDDLALIERPRNLLGPETVESMADAVGLMAVQPLSRGEIVIRSLLRSPPLVQRGSVVTLRLAADGLILSAEGLAVDTGALGDRIRVVNPSSKAVLVGTVAARGTVSIDAGSTPMVVSGDPSAATLPPGFPGRSGMMSLYTAGISP